MLSRFALQTRHLLPLFLALVAFALAPPVLAQGGEEDAAEVPAAVEEVSEELRAALRAAERQERTVRAIHAEYIDVRDRFAAGNADLESQVGDLRRELDNEIARLRQLSREVDLAGGEGAPFRAAIADVTGRVVTEDLSVGTLLALGQNWMSRGQNYLIEEGPGLALQLLLILLIWFAFKLLAGIVGRITRKALATPKIKASTLLKEFLIGLTAKVVLLIGVLVILSQLGVEIGPLLAGIGIAGFIAGFALQDTLSNFAAGVMILFYRPYDVGDFVSAGGVMGTVREMSLVSTVLTTPDNQRMIVPNKKIWGDTIQNITANPTRRVDLTFGISYGDDMGKAQGILERVVKAHPAVLADPAPNIRVHKLGDSSVDFICRPWVNTSDYWAVYWDLTRQVKEAFDNEGISIPFPQRDVHFYNHSSEPARI